MKTQTSLVAEPQRSAMVESGDDAQASASIPLVDLGAQYANIATEIDAAIRQVLTSTAFILGPQVAEFERAFARLCGVSHCVAVSSGTAALELVLRAHGIGPGDEVITVAHTFIATAEAVSAVGARPVFVDIDPTTYCMDAAAFRSAITSQTRAALPVHIYGHPAPMRAINAVAASHGIIVIEDAAQAHMAVSDGGILAGALAAAACFSFYPGKNLGAYGDAGAVTTDDAAVAERIRLLRNHGRRAKYVHDVVGFGERMDTLQAAVLLAKLPHLPHWTLARRSLAARYTQQLEGLDLELPREAEGVASAWHLYVVRTRRRDALLKWLKANDVEAGVHYPLPLHLQPAYQALGYRRGDLPVTEMVAESCLSLPLYPEMTHNQQDRVVGLIRTFFAEATNVDA